MKPFILKSLVFLFLSSLVNTLDAGDGRDTVLEIEKCVRLEGGFVMSYKTINAENSFRPGGSIHYSYCLKSGQYCGFGLGAGVHLFKEEGFIPFYIDFIGMLNNTKNSPFIDLQAGYAFSWSNEYNDFPEHEFNGGMYLGVGLGKKMKLNDSFSSYLSVSYRHQFASLYYETPATEEHNEKLYYYMLVINLGIILEQK